MSRPAARNRHGTWSEKIEIKYFTEETLAPYHDTGDHPLAWQASLGYWSSDRKKPPVWWEVAGRGVVGEDPPDLVIIGKSEWYCCPVCPPTPPRDSSVTSASYPPGEEAITKTCSLRGFELLEGCA
jgi:hypothetical protein